MPANAVYQQQIIWLTHRHRRQASSHTDLCLTQNFPSATVQNVGVGLPAMAVVQAMMCWLAHCIREQARSHLYAAVFA